MKLTVLLTFLGTFDVNFMDDVGQTLLNWASAFGTLEMVQKYIDNCILFTFTV